MRRMFSILTLLLIAVALAATGCGSSNDNGNSGGGGGATTSKPAGGGSGGTVSVAMKDIAFQPETVAVKVGQTVTWKNEDSVQHDVQSTSGEGVHSDLFGKGGTFSFTPTKTGTIEYVCSVHPSMTGSIIVEK